MRDSILPSLLAFTLLLSLPAGAQESTPDDGFTPPPFHEYDPPSTLNVPAHPTTRAKYPFIDVHNHQWGLAEQDLAALVADMDKLNMGVMVNLSGRGFERVTLEDGSSSFRLRGIDWMQTGIERVAEEAPGRIVQFTNLDFNGFGEPDWSARAVADLERDVRLGARGLKIFKSLGMSTVDIHGERVPVNAPGLDPVWAKCGELGIPVLIHTADPAQFWQPKDAENERLFELMERPNRRRDPSTEPSFEELLAEQHDIFRKHPETVFINAHLGWFGNDLDRLGKLFEELPNVHTEIGAVLAELGRQPRHAREFFIRWQDRILFGKDSWQPEEYHVYFRVLETADEYFDYYRRRHAFWKIYGLDLPDDVLRKVYYKNALRIVPGLDRSLFPQD